MKAHVLRSRAVARPMGRLASGGGPGIHAQSAWWLTRRSTLAILHALLLVALLAPTSLDAQQVDVTVTIMRVVQVSCDEGAFEACPDDYFPRVDVANQGFQCSDRFGALEDCSDSVAQDWPGTKAFQNQGDIFPTKWQFTRTVDANLQTIPISIQIWDEDGSSDNDILDITSQGPDRTLSLTLDLTTGAWTGEVPQNLGYSQGDHATIIFGISLSSTADIDGDGIPDWVERFGVLDGAGNVVANMAALGADPCRPTIAVEIDYMADSTHSHRPTDAAMNEVVAAFNAAPVNAVAACPYAGFPTQPTGINFIYTRDSSTPLTHQANLTLGSGAEGVRNANFNTALAPFFHYSLWAHDQASGDSSSGLCCSDGNTGKDFLVTLGSWTNQVGTTRDQSGTLMHELGHALGFGHGGGDGINCKPNYLSIMSYTLQVTGIPDPTLAAPNVDLRDAAGNPGQDGVPDARLRLDYSQSALAQLDERLPPTGTGLVEANGIGDGTDLATWSDDGGTTIRTAAGNGPIDWDASCSPANGTCTTASPTPAGACACDTNPVTVDVNNLNISGCGASTGEVLMGYDDWQNLKYRAAFAPGAGFSPPASVELDFPTAQRLKALLADTLKADPSIAKTAGAGTVLTGANVTYTLAAGNNRAVAAETVTVTDNLPPSLTFLSCSAGGGGACGGSGNSRTVTFTQLPGNSTTPVTLVANVKCEVPDGTVIGNTANIASATPDFTSGNNSSSASITASNPPPVISNVFVSPSTMLWSPAHNMVDVTLNYTVTDNCGQSSLALSVVSNEPINGLGDGDMAPDWEVVDAHHVRLRAERSGSGTGRIYTITITASDSGGGSSSQQVTVTVPRDQR